jgi:hypothetical protein
MLKIGCFWVSIMLSLMCIIPQHMLLFEIDILHILVLNIVWVVFY